MKACLTVACVEPPVQTRPITQEIQQKEQEISTPLGDIRGHCSQKQAKVVILQQQLTLM